MSEKLKEIITNLNNALHTIEYTAHVANEAMEELSYGPDSWKASDIRDFCMDLKKSIRENAKKHGYYYW